MSNWLKSRSIGWGLLIGGGDGTGCGVEEMMLILMGLELEKRYLISTIKFRPIPVGGDDEGNCARDGGDDDGCSMMLLLLLSLLLKTTTMTYLKVNREILFNCKEIT